ncbi:MAG: hypothetical protein EBY65_04645, partial [Acidimicrobiia bacterium]|nr:hypothetical protein [Acidimicrobiia bacterium]
ALGEPQSDGNHAEDQADKADKRYPAQIQFLDHGIHRTGDKGLEAFRELLESNVCRERRFRKSDDVVTGGVV